jgi:hypothetical protein
MNSLGRGVLGSDFGLLLDLTIFFVIGIPLMAIAYLIWDATKDE